METSTGLEQDHGCHRVRHAASGDGLLFFFGAVLCQSPPVKVNCAWNTRNIQAERVHTEMTSNFLELHDFPLERISGTGAGFGGWISQTERSEVVSFAATQC